MHPLFFKGGGTLAEVHAPLCPNDIGYMHLLVMCAKGLSRENEQETNGVSHQESGLLNSFPCYDNLHLFSIKAYSV